MEFGKEKGVICSKHWTWPGIGQGFQSASSTPRAAIGSWQLALLACYCNISQLLSVWKLVKHDKYRWICWIWPATFPDDLIYLKPERYTLGDKLQQHGAAMHSSKKTPRVHWRIFVKTFSLQKNFVTTTSCTNSDWFDFLRLVAATKFCGRDKDFHKKFSSTHKMICRCDHRNVMLQLIAWPVHTQSDLSPDVLLQLVSLRVFQP